MKLYLDQQEVPYQGSSLQDFIAYWQEFYRQIQAGGRYIHYVDIDGTSHYGNYDVEIVQHYDGIGNLHVHTISMEDAIAETRREIAEYGGRVLSFLPDIANRFYGEMAQDDWELFAQFTEGLDWMTKSMSFLITTMSMQSEASASAAAPLQETYEALVGTIQNLEQAIQKEDYIHSADIVQYEFPQPIEQLIRQLGDAK